MTERETEICVIGGGPAGTSAALRLRELGHRVCLVERSAAPRRRPGESLAPSIEGVLDALVVRDRLEREGVLRPVRGEVRWSEERAALEEGAHRCCDRSELDGLLLEIARERGVEVLQPARARSASRTPAGWRIDVEPSLSLTCRFVVDASGRAGFLPGARRRTAAPTLALHGYFRGAGLPGSACVEAAPEGWSWGAPLPTGVFSAMVFVEPAAARAAGRAGLEALLRACLGRSELLAACAGAPLEGGARALDATPYAADAIVGPGWIKLGEASFALDPLSGAGVERAMRSALAGSVVAHTLLARPERAELAASFHRERQRESVEQHRLWAAGYYREGRHPQRPFWQRRAGDGAAAPVLEPRRIPGPEALRRPVEMSRDVRFEDTPCVVGDEIAAVLALSRPAWPRPVAFVEGVEVAPLLAMLVAGEPLHVLVRRWAARVPERKAIAAAMWLLQRGVLVAPDEASPGPDPVAVPGARL